jgi:hypothetical protein
MFLPEFAAFVITVLVLIGIGLAVAAVLYSRSRRSQHGAFQKLSDLSRTLHTGGDRYAPRREPIVYHPPQTSNRPTTTPNRLTTTPSPTVPRSAGVVIQVAKEPFVTPTPDGSIIDVTGLTAKIDVVSDGPTVVKFPGGVPNWQHQYVYSASELQRASAAQQAFYVQFRAAFVKGRYYDLEGNSNYAFILLFDLVDSYNAGPNAQRFIDLLTKLGEVYPKTSRYLYSALHKRMIRINDWQGVERIRELQDVDPVWGGYEYDYWRLGSRVKQRLGLSNDEVKLLNRLSDTSNIFLDIEYCGDQVIFLFLNTVKHLRSAVEEVGPGLDQRVHALADLIAKKHYHYRANSENYRYGLEFATDHLYTLIFKRCENAVREHYGHKRKVNAAPSYSEHLNLCIEDAVLAKANELISTQIRDIKPPDTATEIVLNALNTTRWKVALEKLKESVDTGTSDQFGEEVKRLGELNKDNLSVENIYYEASKFISKTDKKAALKLYIYYLHHDLKSAKFDNKKLTKTIQKSLFSTNEQLRDFEGIVSELVATKDLGRALAAVAAIYEVKRRRISLDRGAIKSARHKHSETVDLLNEYLQDEFEDDNTTIATEEIDRDEVRMEITAKFETAALEPPSAPVGLTSVQIKLLDLFAKSSLTVSQSEVENFARDNGAFRNQVIESINDACYELLDDVLIEEDDDLYVVNEEYYRTVMKS